MRERQPLPAFRRLLEVADAMIDPLHFGGGDTSYEGFAVGTPIVTLPGGFLRNRITYAQYTAMDIDDAIASDAEDYVKIAVRLATDPDARADVSRRILEHNEKLYENALAVRELEEFLRERVG